MKFVILLSYKHFFFFNSNIICVFSSMSVGPPIFKFSLRMIFCCNPTSLHSFGTVTRMTISNIFLILSRVFKFSIIFYFGWTYSHDTLWQFRIQHSSFTFSLFPKTKNLLALLSLVFAKTSTLPKTK